jgi:FkbM family methyltransferase
VVRIIAGVSYQQRSRFYDRAARLTSYVSTSVGEALFLVLTQDQNVGRSLFLKQSRGEIGVLSRAVALVEATLGDEGIKGRSFLDVGANIGTTTVPAMLDHPFATAVAFEPEPRNALTLRLNLVLNGIEERATALEVALSNRSGTSELVVYPDQGGKHWIAADSDKLKTRDDDTAVVEVRTVTLDELAAEGVVEPDGVGLLWIDAQAHEGHILEGASCLVERGVPVVIEWDPSGLDRLGDRGTLEAIIEEHYTHFIDLRASHDPKGPAFELRPAVGLGGYAERFLEPGGRNFTDILMLRLSGGDVPADLDIRRLLQREGALKRRSPGGRSRMELLRELISALDELDGDEPQGPRPKGKRRATTQQRKPAKKRRAPGTAQQSEPAKKQRAPGGKSGGTRARGKKSAGSRKASGPKRQNRRKRDSVD